MYNVQWRDISVSTTRPKSFTGIVRTTGLAPSEIAPRGYFYFLMAWSWEVEDGNAMKHRYDELDSIFVLSAKSPYFDGEVQQAQSDTVMTYQYHFTLPPIPSEISLGGDLKMVAVMDERREILLKRSFSF